MHAAKAPSRQHFDAQVCFSSCLSLMPKTWDVLQPGSGVKGPEKCNMKVRCSMGSQTGKTLRCYDKAAWWVSSWLTTFTWPTRGLLRQTGRNSFFHWRHWKLKFWDVKWFACEHTHWKIRLGLQPMSSEVNHAFSMPTTLPLMFTIPAPYKRQEGRQVAMS